MARGSSVAAPPPLSISLLLLSTTQHQLAAVSAQLCPSALGPGEHQIDVVVVPAAGLGVQEQARTFFVHVPDDMPTEEVMPGLVSWHGCGGNVAPPWPDFEVGTGLNQATAVRKWFNIYPKGTSATGGSLGFNWNGEGACTTSPQVRSASLASVLASS